MTAPAPSRTDRYLARVLAHLPTLADDAARRKFLSREFDRWDQRYATFTARVDCGRIELTGDHATAFDYVDTIGEIAKLQHQYERKAA